MFRSQLFDHLQGGRLSCLVLLLPPLPVCVVKLFIWYVAVCCLCVCACLMYLSVGCLVVVHNQTSHKQVHQAEMVVTALSTKDDPPEDGQTIVTETCRVLMMCFTNIFNNLEF